MAVFKDESSAHEIAAVLLHFNTRRKLAAGVQVLYYNHHRTIVKGKLTIDMATKMLSLKTNKRKGKRHHRAFASGQFILARPDTMVVFPGDTYMNVLLSQWWFTDSNPPEYYSCDKQESA